MMTEIWNLSTLCRCCHSDGCFKSLKQIYKKGIDSEEIYEIMLQQTLGIRISQPQVDASYTICDTCIERLRDAHGFKKQVLMCERKFEIYCTNEQFLSGIAESIKSEVDHQNNYDGDVIDNNLLQDDTNVCYKDECNTVTIKNEVTIHVDFGHTVEDTKQGIKVNDKDIKTEEVVKTLEDKVKNNKYRTSKKHKKQVLNKKAKTVKESKLNAKKWETKKIRLKLVHSYIVQVKTNNGLTYSCKTCEGSYETKKAILKHIRFEHIGRYKCEHCDKPFPHVNTLRRHVKNIHAKELYECNKCNKIFKCNYSLKEHENFHTKEFIFKCDVCNKDWYSKSALRKHIRQQHKPDNKSFICDICGWAFYDKTNLGKHVNSVHLKLRPFACNVCDKTYTAKKHLNNHMNTHSENSKAFKCEHCTRCFALEKSLRYHRMEEHESRFPCRYCPAIFTDKKHRDVHTRSHPKDTLSNPHTCDLCGKILMSKFTLNRHLELHEGIKRYSCEICDRKFTQKAILKRHNKRKHDPNARTEKVKCEQCKKMVRNLERHMATHNDETRFFCDLCDKSYAENNALTRHKNHAHFGFSYDCVFCGKKYINKRSLASHKVKVHKVKNEVDKKDEVTDVDIILDNMNTL